MTPPVQSAKLASYEVSVRFVPLLVLLGACTHSDRNPLDESPIYGVGETESWRMTGLHGPAYVLRTDANMPRIYAADREDLARVEGFVVARDRFFVMDMTRRLAKGEVSSILGDAGLASDAESRATGITFVAQQLHETMSPEQLRYNEAFVAGINDYIEAVRAGALPAPSEYDLAKGFLGAEESVELMQPWVASDVAAVGATLIYQLGFETGDVGNQAAFDQIPGRFDGAALAELRQNGLYDDIWLPEEPVFPITSANGWQTETRARPNPPSRPAVFKELPKVIADRLVPRFEKMQNRMGRDHEDGWGSNAWAVMGEKTTDGRALIAGDGHLPLSVPSLFYPIALDTSELGGGDTHQVGVVLPGMPLLAVGTNGRVGWSQTQLMGDITDWYREELTLDAQGAPTHSLFQGAQKPLIAVTESVEVADVPLLGSVGRTITWQRYTTFDGRWIADIEGNAVAEGYVPGQGETVVRLGESLVVPSDVDGDGVITAVSFDYTAFDRGNLLGALDRWGHSDDVAQFREATKRLVAYSQNIVAADANGSILYTGYQAVPCRGYLDRDDAGHWLPGANPSMLLDGTKYGGFTIPVTDDGLVDESKGADPYSCVVPFDKYPQSVDPARGYVLTANNDPGGASLDGDLSNDPYYIGGPWTEGYRADTIDRTLLSLTTSKTASVATMQGLQANTESRMGEQLLPYFLDAIEHAQTAATGTPAEGSADERLAALYETDAAAIDEVHDRLTAWQAAGFPTPSGVETFYNIPVSSDAANSVATTIFNAWMGRFITGTLDDEGFPGVFKPTGGTGRTRIINKMLLGRGPGNPLGLASFNPETNESAFFDVLGTPAVETSDEVIVDALLRGLVYLRSPETDPGEGGYGTEDMDEWVWGLRHWVHFDSILKEVLGDDPTFSFIAEKFSITPDRLPLAEGLTSADPRYGMRGFPRDGDQFAVDAANSGLNGSNFEYGSGPVFRLVVSLGPDGVGGENVIPGGQSGLNDSPHFDDQIPLWLANQALPLRFTIEEATAGATARETFLPADPL